MQSPLTGEVLSDGEEECFRDRDNKMAGRKAIYQSGVEVIEISSDEDEVELKTSESWPSERANGVESFSKGLNKGVQSIVECTGSDKTLPQSGRDPDIIELSDSSEENTPLKLSAQPKGIPACTALRQGHIYESNGIMIFNSPSSARKPIRLVTTSNPSTSTTRQYNLLTLENLVVPSLSNADEAFKIVELSREQAISDTNFVTPKVSTPRRQSKKALAEAEQLKREQYAQGLFKTINNKVFNNELPADTKLAWSKRLLTTAGRARWHRSIDGLQTAEIELAQKILDCEERIRNTLSHEMCHLATWIIDGDPKQGHGKLFAKWAKKLMRKCPEIIVTTKHEYEISHPYQWRCENCSQIYGRFSKSIQPDECVCGACREGRLVPLFKTKIKPSKDKSPKTSRMSTGKSRDSPHVLHTKAIPQKEISGADSEVENLIRAMDSTFLS